MVKAGPKYYRDALAYYTRALEQKSCIAPNNSVYYCNRAAVQLMLRTYTPSCVRRVAHAYVNVLIAVVRVCVRVCGAQATTTPWCSIACLRLSAATPTSRPTSGTFLLARCV